MSAQERFQRAPVGAGFKRGPLFEISRFRLGQQPRLRELSLVKLVFWSFGFAERGESSRAGGG